MEHENLEIECSVEVEFFLVYFKNSELVYFEVMETNL